MRSGGVERLAAPRRPASRPADRGSSRSRPRPARRRRRGIRPRRRRWQIPPMPIDRDRDRGAHRAHLLQRHRPHRRAREPAVAGRRAGPPVAGSIAVAFSVLISETASAPPCSAADRDRRGVGDVRGQLHDQRLLGQRAQRLQQGLGLGRLLADDQPGVDVGAGDVQLDRRHLVARADRLDQAGELLPARSPSPRRSAAPAARPAAAGPRRGSPPGPCWAARSS